MIAFNEVDPADNVQFFAVHKCPSLHNCRIGHGRHALLA